MDGCVPSFLALCSLHGEDRGKIPMTQTHASPPPHQAKTPQKPSLRAYMQRERQGEGEKGENERQTNDTTDDEISTSFFHVQSSSREIMPFRPTAQIVLTMREHLTTRKIQDERNGPTKSVEDSTD
mmetsp:Transcript_31660/g.62656  ORF Transcript_31660/g.62656 Transcript_31660/m.62656 type:complete len:126 (-) Transcript_31660:152-529(-)